MPPAVLLDRQLARLSGIDLTLIRHRRLGRSTPTGSTRPCSTLEPLAERLAFVRPPFDLANVAATADAFKAGSDGARLHPTHPAAGRPRRQARAASTRRWITCGSSPTRGTAVIVVGGHRRTKDSKGRSSYYGDGAEPGQLPRVERAGSSAATTPSS